MFAYTIQVPPTDRTQVGRFFQLRELACKHCGQVRINPDSVRLFGLLDTLRERLGAPVTITSGHRCPEHNKAVGGAHNSKHIWVPGQGAAADITARVPYVTLVRAAQEIFTAGGVGVYPGSGFVHVDNGTKRRW